MCLGPEQGRGLEPQAAGEPPPRPPPWVSGDPEDEHTGIGLRALEGDRPRDPRRGRSSRAGQGRKLCPVTVPDERRDGTCCLGSSGAAEEEQDRLWTGGEGGP